MDVLWLLWKKCRSNSKRPTYRTFSASTKIPVDSITNSTPISSKSSCCSCTVVCIYSTASVSAVLPWQGFWALSAGLDALDLVSVHNELISAPDLHIVLELSMHRVIPCMSVTHVEAPTNALRSVQLLLTADMRLYEPGYNLNMLGKYGSWSS